jgi:hypothetical protein
LIQQEHSRKVQLAKQSSWQGLVVALVRYKTLEHYTVPTSHTSIDSVAELLFVLEHRNSICSHWRQSCTSCRTIAAQHFSNETFTESVITSLQSLYLHSWYFKSRICWQTVRILNF